MSTDRDPFHRNPFGDADADACATLPCRVVREIGLWTHKGAKLDLAVLSALAHHHRVAHLPDRAWARRVLESPRILRDPHLPTILDLEAGEFWTSMERIGRDLMARWRFADVADGPHDGAFGGARIALGFGPYPPEPEGVSNEALFQRNVRNAVARLEKGGYVRRVRTVQFAGQSPGAMGAVFRVDEGAVPPSSLVQIPAPSSLPLHPGGPDAALGGLLDGAGDDEQVPVADVVGAAYVLFDAFKRSPNGSSSVRAFRDGAPSDLAVAGYRAVEVRSRLASPGRTASFLRWVRKQARTGPADDLGPDAERHASVGVWPVASAGFRPRRPSTPYVVPWLVLDFDRGPDIEEAFGAAQRAARDLVALGVDPGDLLCCPTGGRGVHVHVPCGALGTPLYRNADDAKGAMRRFVAASLDEDVDQAVLSPVHLVRAVGSGYHVPPPPASPEPASVAPPVGFKVRIPTGAFLGMGVDEAASRALAFAPSEVPDPRRAAPVPALVAEVVRASYAAKGQLARKGSKTDAVRAVEGGVGVGERNGAAFLMATHFLWRENRGEVESWGRLQRWNSANSPPLDEGELRGVFESALSRGT